jgi:5-methylthioadenosine/S-adenosylhomocysteine deaminase
LKKSRALADKYKALVHTHLSETKDEVAIVKKKYHMRPSEYFDSLGLLSEMTVCAHCIELSDGDIGILTITGTSAAHCPRSNMKLGEGCAPVVKMLSKKVNVSIGTDGAASNNALNMFGDMGMAALLHKVKNADPTAVNAKTALRMATINGAKALGLGDKTGSLETGKYADIIIVSLDAPNVTPSYDPYSTLVYSANGTELETVIIGGKVVMRDKKVLTIDSDRASRDVRLIAAEIKKGRIGK